MTGKHCYRKFYFFIVIFLSAPGFLKPGYCCPADVTCTTIGPPTWEYTVTTYGTGRFFFWSLTGLCNVTDAGTPLDWTALPSSSYVSFTTSAADSCGVIVAGFSVTATGPGVADGTVSWATGSSTGTTRGPVCFSTPTPTPTPTPTTVPFLLQRGRFSVLFALLFISSGLLIIPRFRSI